MDPLPSSQSRASSRRLSDSESLNRKMDKGATQVHVTTLDEVVSVNTFFTVAVFIGMTFSKDATDLFLDDNNSCKPGPDTVKHLMVYEVVSFSFFLFSTLVAHGMKLFVIFSNTKNRDDFLSAAINDKFLRFGMLASATGTVVGTLLLMMSMVNIIQLRLGSLNCDDGWSDSAAVPLLVLVATGISIFISSAFYAFLH